jgi:cobaltochelatase CobT
MLDNETSYRVFTRRFDRVVSADELPSREAQERAWARFMEGTLERRTTWELEGIGHAERLRASVLEDSFRNTLVTLLVDHSGSMRGEPMLLAAAAVDVARAFLVHLGASVEVLGFTTRFWKRRVVEKIVALDGKAKEAGPVMRSPAYHLRRG